MNKEPVYLMMIENLDGRITLANGGENKNFKLLVARKPCRDILDEMGTRLLNDGMIAGYQILVTDGLPVRNYTVEEITAH